MKMPLSYRIRMFLSSRLGEFRTGDRVAVTGSWLGDYTGTVRHSVGQSVSVEPDPGVVERAFPDVYGVKGSNEAKSQCVRIWNG
ncbi:hypothetical protein ABZ896_23035 [Streptomyces sp. NPDC047072]|uniref:hypothetical protein n=1 Tax=Streptomyces sp. NPDC047072 TaxID=3154809 RepID=UPI0033D02ECA